MRRKGFANTGYANQSANDGFDMIVIDIDDISQLTLRGGNRVISIHVNPKGEEDQKLLVVYKNRDGLLASIYTSISGVYNSKIDLRSSGDKSLDLVRIPYQLSQSFSKGA